MFINIRTVNATSDYTLDLEPFFFQGHMLILTATRGGSMAVSALRRAIVEVKQLWSVIEWMTKNLREI
jgi:hypothetical protein